MFNYLLMTTADKDNYHNRLFLVHNKYFIIFKISLSESNPTTLRRFYMVLPFMMINIANITEIISNTISISSSYCTEKIRLSNISGNNNNNEAEWLHKRLMDCSIDYRYQY